jgi:hypothetical protein
MTPAVSRAEEPAGVGGVVQGLLCGVEVAVGGVAEQNLTVFHRDETEVDRERFCHKRQSTLGRVLSRTLDWQLSGDQHLVVLLEDLERTTCRADLHENPRVLRRGVHPDLATTGRSFFRECA